MQLIASKTAQYFIHNEYHKIELEEDRIIISSHTTEERIPFSIWNGNIQISRGILWGSIQIFAHITDNVQQSWLVQGLPWPECKQYANDMVSAYQHWYQDQYRKLVGYLPHWQSELVRLQHLPSFLPNSHLQQWLDSVGDDLSAMHVTIDDLIKRSPQAVEKVAEWYNSPVEHIEERNHLWLETERRNWEVLFAQIESSPLNLSQQRAVLLNDDHNLVLAGAGSGKTSVLIARVAYLLQSHLAKSEEILLLAFGREAAREMSERVATKVGLSADGVKISTFHQLGLQILNQVESNQTTISPLALDEKLKEAWCTDWLKKHWMTPTNFKRWQKHLASWPVAYIKGDDELGSHVENPQLISWLMSQIEQLSQFGFTKKEIQQRIVSQRDYTRLNSELALCWPCYQSWLQRLKEDNHIDFNIMITRATHYVNQKKFRSQWKFIMVDEYQDISPQRLSLIQALCDQREGEANLFAVGDDWQSIYRFAGSSIELTTEFQRRFPHSTVAALDTTYRFNNQIGDVANRFIQQNPEQLTKDLNSFHQQSAPAVCVTSNNRVESILDELDREIATTRGKSTKKSLLLLGRNHYHKPELLSDWKSRYRNLSIEFMTCHASKGKEADYVIVLSVDEGQFPARVKTVHLDGALLVRQGEFPHAEERRLFYVAMTRAREKLWITCNNKGSAFIKELLNDGYPIEKIN
jgi:DNA helicase-4